MMWKMCVNTAVVGLLSGFMVSCADGTQFGGKKSGSERVKFSEQNNPNSDEAIMAAGLNTVEISCKDEQSEMISKSFDKTLQSVIFSPQEACQKDFERIDQKRVNLIDLIIVIDISGSMQGEIDTVKDNLQEFSNRLSDNGWDARFGLVGFTDKVSALQKNFVEASALTSVIERLKAKGGGDHQEAGQKAIALAVEMFKMKREGSIPALLYITDAPAWGTTKDDLSINFVKTVVEEAMNENLKNLQLYSSVFGGDLSDSLKSRVYDAEDLGFEVSIISEILDTFAKTEFSGVEGLFGGSAKEQVTSLRKELAIPGLDVAFPLRASSLLEDVVVSIEKTQVPVSAICKIKTVRLNGSELPSEDRNKQWRLTQDQLAGEKINLTIERSCGEQGYKVANIKLVPDTVGETKASE